MSDDSFLREVEEELRSDKLKAFWRRFAPFIIGGAVLIVLLVGANEVWKWYRSSTAANASDQYYAAVEMADSGDVAGAQAAFAELEASGPAGYGILARFQEAALLAEQGDPQGAIEAYDALAASLDQRRLRELAYILGGYLAVDHLDVGAVEQRVGGLTGEDSAMRNSAREALGLAHYKAGNLEEARINFEAMAADPNAGQDIQLRAFIYLEQLASTGVDVSEDLLGATGPLDTAPEQATVPAQSPSLDTVGQPLEAETEQ
ncbi:tetratricopeptide repeat protein [Pelagibacterium nitratireducens]|uniref:Tetratricopeptide repeat protein n=1 Tax=Pelagibacterium nitratireducens TaxID=1046114 RepID=A0ABZ2HVV1_9HYPH